MGGSRRVSHKKRGAKDQNSQVITWGEEKMSFGEQGKGKPGFFPLANALEILCFQALGQSSGEGKESLYKSTPTRKKVRKRSLLEVRHNGRSTKPVLGESG